MVRSGCMLGRQDRGTKQRGVLRIFKKSDGDRSIAGAEQQGRLRSTQQVCVCRHRVGRGPYRTNLIPKGKNIKRRNHNRKSSLQTLQSDAQKQAQQHALSTALDQAEAKTVQEKVVAEKLLRQKPTLRQMGCQASRVKQAMHTVTVPEGRNCAAASCTGLAGEGDATGSWSYRVWIEPIVVGSRHARPVSLVHVGKRSSKACGNCARIAVQRGQTSKMCEVVSCTPRSQKGQTGEETNLDL